MDVRNSFLGFGKQQLVFLRFRHLQLFAWSDHIFSVRLETKSKAVGGKKVRHYSLVIAFKSNVFVLNDRIGSNQQLRRLKSTSASGGSIGDATKLSSIQESSVCQQPAMA